jgi:hypothetical protein
MLITGTIILLCGYLLAQSGFRAMIDPTRPVNRAGGMRVFIGTALATSGVGTCLVSIFLRL